MKPTIVFLVVAVALLPYSVRAAQPNVIVILSDDAGYADFGVTGGGTLVPTPHIDRLAREGIFCRQGYVTASTCTPSRMGLMSGRYQQRFGAECNVPTIPTPGYTKEDLGLDTEQRTLGDAMKAQGYRTMAIGKWHLGELPKYHPNQRGFDEFYGFLGGSRSYWATKQPSHGRAIRRNEKAVDELAEITYLTDNFTDAAIDFIGRYQKQPFFLYLAYNAVHGPFHAKEEDLEQCAKIEPASRWMVSAMTKSMDDNIGRLLAQLDGLGLTENTLIVFLNDNGGTQEATHSNGSLRGFKGTYWEGGIRVPYVVSWPAQLPKGKRFDHPVSSLDLLPTCLAAAGAEVDPAWAVDGVNLLPYFNGEREGAPHETLFWRFWRVAVAREGAWKLLRVAENPLEQKRELLAPLMLINLDDDPAETTNLAAKFPEKTQALLRKLEAWEKPLARPRWYDGSNWKHWQDQQLKNHTMTP
ncbi:MAG: sulfatase-like hydrolase/transferase [Candidatus Nealsonbacteria bacterium]|nr:sulfatase-like hydrolase/transferase [Candidatus Nealsonbacteria bacterium]